MLEQILKGIIGNRTVEDLTTSEARNIVSKFYDKITLAEYCLSQTAIEKLDYKVKQLLDKYELGYFAA